MKIDLIEVLRECSTTDVVKLVRLLDSIKKLADENDRGELDSVELFEQVRRELG